MIINNIFKNINVFRENVKIITNKRKHLNNYFVIWQTGIYCVKSFLKAYNPLRELCLLHNLLRLTIILNIITKNELLDDRFYLLRFVTQLPKTLRSYKRFRQLTFQKLLFHLVSACLGYYFQLGVVILGQNGLMNSTDLNLQRLNSAMTQDVGCAPSTNYYSRQ